MNAQPNFGLQGIWDREDPFIPRRRQADPLAAFPSDPYIERPKAGYMYVRWRGSAS